MEGNLAVNPVLLILPAFVGFVAVVVVIGNMQSRRRARRLKAERGEHTLEEFVTHFAGEPIPRAVIVAVHRVLQEQMDVDGFPVLPSDRLREVYGIDGAGVDWDEFTEDLWKVCDCRDAEPGEGDDANPDMTVEELVRVTARFSRLQD